MGKYLANGKDSKVWAYAALYMLTTTNSYSIAYFLPIILEKSMHFSVAKAQCLVAPPYVAAAIVMYVQAIYSDKWRMRGPIVAGNALMGLLGLGLLGYLEDPAPRYFGVFLATIAGELVDKFNPAIWCLSLLRSSYSERELSGFSFVAEVRDRFSRWEVSRCWITYSNINLH
jgi:sugar phosphate permease